MNIYKVYLSEGFTYFSVLNFEDENRIENKDYTNIEKVNIKFENDDRDMNGDITILDTSSSLLFSSKAKKIFNNEKFIFIPQTTNYYLLDALVIDALNMKKSKIDYFSGTDRIKRINKYIFEEGKILNIDTFKLPIIASPVFVTESFLKKYSENNLTGLEFSLVN